LGLRGFFRHQKTPLHKLSTPLTGGIMAEPSTLFLRCWKEMGAARTTKTALQRCLRGTHGCPCHTQNKNSAGEQPAEIKKW